MKKFILFIFSLVILSCEKQEILSDDFLFDLIIPALSIDNFGNNIIWNDHIKGKSKPYEFNNDGTPDIITSIADGVNIPIVKILDYNQNELYTFDVLQFNNQIRDSLNSVFIDYSDLNDDGYNDIVLSYMGEWGSGDNAIYKGINSYVLISNGNLSYTPIEIYDDVDEIQFGVSIINNNILLGTDNEKNTFLFSESKNNFNTKTINQSFKPSMMQKYDWDSDGILDVVNLSIQNKILSIIKSTNEVVNYDFSNTGYNFSYTVSGNSTEWQGERISVLDYDNDGDGDIVIGGFIDVGTETFHTHKLFKNNNGKFQYIESFIEDSYEIEGMHQTWVKDIDNDGDLDLYYPLYWNKEVNNNLYFWWENTNHGFKINKNYSILY